MSNYLAQTFGQANKKITAKIMAAQLLPANPQQKKLLEIVGQQESTITLLTGHHGSGKTPLLPALVSTALKGTPAAKIVVAQPNALNAMTVCNWMSPSKKDEKLIDSNSFANGKLKGKVRLVLTAKDQDSAEDAILTYTTDAMLETWLSISTNHPIPDYKVVFIDDVHEQTMATETTLLRIRDVIRSRNEANDPIHFVIMSPETDVGVLQKYFAIDDSDVIRLPPEAHDPAKPSLTEHWLESVSVNARRIPDIYRKVEEIIEDKKKTSGLEEVGILVVLPTKTHVDKAHTHFSDTLKDSKIKCFKMYTGMSRSPMDLIWAPGPKIITAVDSCLVGLIIRDIYVVFVTDVTTAWDIDPTYGQALLTNVHMSQLEVQQYAGRVGRIRPGTCYYMFGKDQYPKLLQRKASPLITGDCTEYIVRLYNIFPGSYPVEGLMDLMVYPQERIVQSVTRSLRILGLIEREEAGYYVASPLEDVLSIPSIHINTRLFLAIKRPKSPDEFLLRVNPACILSVPHRQFVGFNNPGSRNDKVLNSAEATSPIAFHGDVWASLWWFTRCIEQGIDRVITENKGISIDKSMFTALMAIRD